MYGAPSNEYYHLQYFINLPSTPNDEEQIFSTKLDDIEKVRVPLYNKVGQALVTVRNSKTYKEELGQIIMTRACSGEGGHNNGRYDFATS